MKPHAVFSSLHLHKLAQAAALALHVDMCLQLIGTGVQLHVAYPMDTQTPGFEEENKTKVLLPAF